LIAKRKFTEFFDEWARDNFGKRYEPGGRVRGHGEVALERSSAVSSADPGAKMKVSPRLKTAIGLMTIEALEFAL
jgi:hypothetical protein